MHCNVYFPAQIRKDFKILEGERLVISYNKEGCLDIVRSKKEGVILTRTGQASISMAAVKNFPNYSQFNYKVLRIVDGIAKAYPFPKKNVSAEVANNYVTVSKNKSVKVKGTVSSKDGNHLIKLYEKEPIVQYRSLIKSSKGDKKIIYITTDGSWFDIVESISNLYSSYDITYITEDKEHPSIWNE